MKKTKNNQKAWQIVTSSEIHKNPFMRLVRHDVVRPGGRIAPYYVVERPAFSVIIPLTNDGKTLLVGQHRFAVNYFSWEFPMGSVKGKNPLETAKQELKEETGYKASRWSNVGEWFIGPGHTNQIATVFLAQELKAGIPTPETGEFLSIKEARFSEVKDFIIDGTIKDGPTLTAYQLFSLRYPHLLDK